MESHTKQSVFNFDVGICCEVTERCAYEAECSINQMNNFGARVCYEVTEIVVVNTKSYRTKNGKTFIFFKKCTSFNLFPF